MINGAPVHLSSRPLLVSCYMFKMVLVANRPSCQSTTINFILLYTGQYVRSLTRDPQEHCVESHDAAFSDFVAVMCVYTCFLCAFHARE